MHKGDVLDSRMALILIKVKHTALSISSNDEKDNKIRVQAENTQLCPQHERNNAPLTVQVSFKINQDPYGTRSSDSEIFQYISDDALEMTNILFQLLLMNVV